MPINSLLIRINARVIVDSCAAATRGMGAVSAGRLNPPTLSLQCPAPAAAIGSTPTHSAAAPPGPLPSLLGTSAVAGRWWPSFLLLLLALISL